MSSLDTGPQTLTRFSLEASTSLLLAQASRVFRPSLLVFCFLTLASPNNSPSRRVCVAMYHHEYMQNSAGDLHSHRTLKGGAKRISEVGVSRHSAKTIWCSISSGGRNDGGCVGGQDSWPGELEMF